MFIAKLNKNYTVFTQNINQKYLLFYSTPYKAVTDNLFHLHVKILSAYLHSYM
jgi:hypothetical protein